MRRSGIRIMAELIGLIAPLMHVMILAITTGVLGFLCAISITIFGGYAILTYLGLNNLFTIKTIFIIVLVLALLRGVLHYIEQLSNHFIAFKLLALIRDKVFKALRKLSPAKLEGRDKGNLIAFFAGSETSGKRFVQGGFVVRAVSAFVRVVFTACPGDKDSLGIGNSGICGL